MIYLKSYMQIKKIKQVLFNLLNNAIKFTEKGEVVFSVSQDHTKQCILFQIEDTGIGIPPELLEDIFNPFRRVSEKLNSIQGTGLGLAISKEFIRMMGSSPGVISEPGKGSSFFFRLNTSDLLIKDNHIDIDPYTSDYDLTEIAGYHGKKLTILIADDIEENRLVLKQLLDLLGFKVLEAENGKVCMEKFQESMPDLILMDLLMPVIDGWEAADMIRKKDHKTPIIAVSANAYNINFEKCRLAGINDFIAKPFSMSKILKKIEKNLGLKWIFHKNTNNCQQNIEPDLPENPCDVKMPSQIDKEQIINFAQIGNVKAINLILDKIDKQDRSYASLVKTLRNFLKTYDLNEIITFLK